MTAHQTAQRENAGSQICCAIIDAGSVQINCQDGGIDSQGAVDIADVITLLAGIKAGWNYGVTARARCALRGSAVTDRAQQIAVGRDGISHAITAGIGGSVVRLGCCIRCYGERREEAGEQRGGTALVNAPHISASTGVGNVPTGETRHGFHLGSGQAGAA